MVEKQKPKSRFAVGSTDFWGCFDLLCMPTRESKYEKAIFIQVRSRKQYGKSKQDVQDFVNTIEPIFLGAFAWPEGRGKDKVWKFEFIAPEGQGKNTFCNAEDF